MTHESEGYGCLHCYVNGHVQGVFFRASARERAQTLGLTGRAANLGDGRVEITICGYHSNLDLFLEWLHEGPPDARVDKVDWERLPFRPMSGFEIV